MGVVGVDQGRGPVVQGLGLAAHVASGATVVAHRIGDRLRSQFSVQRRSNLVTRLFLTVHLEHLQGTNWIWGVGALLWVNNSPLPHAQQLFFGRCSHHRATQG